MTLRLLTDLKIYFIKLRKWEHYDTKVDENESTLNSLPEYLCEHGTNILHQ